LNTATTRPAIAFFTGRVSASGSTVGILPA
jgi:hypothetical protein